MIQEDARHLVKGAYLAAALLLFSFLPGSITFAQKAYDAQIARLLERDSLTILVTDSGLGGLSVCADLEAQFRALRSTRNVRLVFVNALPDLARTYNAMASKEEQALAFDKALEGFVRWYHPDAILIACNTLSAVYPETRFARNASIPVVSIIDVGSKLIADRAKASSQSAVLILGTATTISSGQYTNKLTALGVPAHRIFSQPCQFLESEIQADPGSDIVNNLAEVYVGEAVEKAGSLPTGTTVQVGLCCSHYGYSVDAFQRAFKQHTSFRFELVNPNKAMVDLFRVTRFKNKVARTSIAVEVASRVRFTDQEIASISAALRPISVKTSEALKHYVHNESLFRLEK